MTTDSTESSTTENSTPADTMPADYEDRVLGCLLGAMAGDAYGVLVVAGDDPTAALEDPAALAVSEATQLTLYTVDGLTEALEWANDGVAADETACLWLAYLRWLDRQGEHLPASAPAPPPRWLDRQEDLLPFHDADPETVTALLTGAMGTRSRPLNPQASGPGALMRSAPFGLVPRIPASMVERLTVDAAALTHGSAAARNTAALFSGVVRSLAIEGDDLAAAVDAARGEEHRLAMSAQDGGSTDGAVDGGPQDGGPQDGGPTAAGTFEAALQAVLEGSSAGSPREHLAATLAHAAAAGRPDASPVITASVAGAIVGALHGTQALPPAYLDARGVPGVVRTLARTLLAATTGT